MFIGISIKSSVLNASLLYHSLDVVTRLVRMPSQTEIGLSGPEDLMAAVCVAPVPKTTLLAMLNGCHVCKTINRVQVGGSAGE